MASSSKNSVVKASHHRLSHSWGCQRDARSQTAPCRAQPSEGCGEGAVPWPSRALLPRGFLLDLTQLVRMGSTERSRSVCSVPTLPEGPRPQHAQLGASPRPWPPSPPAPHLCPVLQPLVELKYPVVGLVAVRRVPPAREQSGSGQSGKEPTVGDTGMGDTQPPFRAGQSPSIPHRSPQASSMPTLQDTPILPTHGAGSPLPPQPPRAYPMPGSRYVGGYMGVGLGGEAAQPGQQWGHLQPCPPQPPLPCHQQQAVGMLTSNSPAG